MAKKKAPTDGGAGKEIKPEQSIHSKQLDEIAKAQRQYVEDEGQDEAIDLDAAAEIPAEPETEEETQNPDELLDDTSAAAAEDTPADGVKDQPSDADMEELVIDGVKTKVEKSKVYEHGKRAMQKEIYAEQKLADAVKRSKELDDRDAALEQERKRVEEILAKHPQDDLSFDEAELESIVDAIKYGDDKKSVEGLKQLVKAVRGAKATKGETLTATEIEATVRQELDRVNFGSALEQFKKPQSEGGYGDLFDGGLIEHALRFEDGRLAADPDGKKLSHLDRMKKAGDNVRAKFQIPTTSSPNNGSRNAQRKAELGDTPLAAGGGNPGGKPAAKPKTELQRHHDAIAATQKQRRGRDE